VDHAVAAKFEGINVGGEILLRGFPPTSRDSQVQDFD
jgi:hypothetical protein